MNSSRVIAPLWLEPLYYRLDWNCKHYHFIGGSGRCLAISQTEEKRKKLVCRIVWLKGKEEGRLNIHFCLTGSVTLMNVWFSDPCLYGAVLSGHRGYRSSSETKRKLLSGTSPGKSTSGNISITLYTTLLREVDCRLATCHRRFRGHFQEEKSYLENHLRELHHLHREVSAIVNSHLRCSNPSREEWRSRQWLLLKTQITTKVK